MRTLTGVGPGRDQAVTYTAGRQTMTTKCVQVSADWISAIRNMVCPECGGRMGGRTREFQCQGECGTDWRAVWERSLAPSKRVRAAKFTERARRASLEIVDAGNTEQRSGMSNPVQLAL